MFGRHVLMAAAIASGVSAAAAQTPTVPDDLIEKGRSIYEAGRLGNGEPLAGYRAGGVTSSGRGAACIRCHQRSGFGLYEGSNLVPPITGPSLFANMRQSARVSAPVAKRQTQRICLPRPSALQRREPRHGFARRALIGRARLSVSHAAIHARRCRYEGPHRLSPSIVGAAFFGREH